MSEKWSWHDAESVVVKSVQAVAVYTNVNGDIVIRQEGDMQDDAIVVIPVSHAEALISAIRREAESILQEAEQG